MVAAAVSRCATRGESVCAPSHPRPSQPFSATPNKIKNGCAASPRTPPSPPAGAHQPVFEGVDARRARLARRLQRAHQRVAVAEQRLRALRQRVELGAAAAAGAVALEQRRRGGGERVGEGRLEVADLLFCFGGVCFGGRDVCVSAPCICARAFARTQQSPPLPLFLPLAAPAPLQPLTCAKCAASSCRAASASSARARPNSATSCAAAPDAPASASSRRARSAMRCTLAASTASDAPAPAAPLAASAARRRVALSARS